MDLQAIELKAKKSKSLLEDERFKETVEDLRKMQLSVFANSGAPSFYLQSPFFPREAKNHGLLATEYELIIALFDVSVLFTSLIFGSFLLEKHMMFPLKLAPVIESSACILFGFIYNLHDKSTVILLGSVFRVAEGIGK